MPSSARIGLIPASAGSMVVSATIDKPEVQLTQNGQLTGVLALAPLFVRMAGHNSV
jgi:hypothetical protein